MSYPLALKILQTLDKQAVAELRFAPPRRWRFDFAMPTYHIAIEIEGGIWTDGRHSRGSGMSADMEKYNEAVSRGWRLLRFTPAQLQGAEWIQVVKSTMNLLGAAPTITTYTSSPIPPFHVMSPTIGPKEYRPHTETKRKGKKA